MLTQKILEQSWHSGALFAFRGKRGDLVKLLWQRGIVRYRRLSICL
ncbi:hypothetical protein [Mesorhizobium sp. M0306]